MSWCNTGTRLLITGFNFNFFKTTSKAIRKSTSKKAKLGLKLPVNGEIAKPKWFLSQQVRLGTLQRPTDDDG